MPENSDFPDRMPTAKIDLQQLLQWGVQHSTKGEDAPPRSTENQEPLPELDPKWLDILMGKTDVQRMREHMATLQNAAECDEEHVLTALEDLRLLCEDIDNASDFVKAGWARDLLVLCDQWLSASSTQQYAVECLWLMQTLIQNHPKNQKQLLELGALSKWVDALDRVQQPEITRKLIACVSALLRHNDPGKVAFLQARGLHRLFQLAHACLPSESEQTASHDFQTLYRIVFFIQHWAVDEPLLCPYMLREMGTEVLLNQVLEWCCVFSDANDNVDDEDPWRWQIAEQAVYLLDRLIVTGQINLDEEKLQSVRRTIHSLTRRHPDDFDREAVARLLQ